MIRLCLALFLPIAALAQTAALRKFEVASLKLSGPQSIRGSQGGPGTKDPTHYRFQSATLQDLVGIAWRVHYFQISSKAPLDKDRFDLIANVPEGATRDQFREMMQALLAERFQLEAHTESRDFPAYELVVAKGGPKMKESSAGGRTSDLKTGDNARFPTLPPGPGMTANYSSADGFPVCRMRAQQQSAATLAEFLRVPGNEPIIDKTGLIGRYDFTLEYALEPPSGRTDSNAAPIDDVFNAVKEQLGLQLISKKLPFQVVVIDSFSKTPAGN